MQGLIRDVRVALRGFQRQPGFAAAAVVMLALAIGASTAVFTVIDAVVFEMPFPDRDRIVALRERHRETGRWRGTPRDRFEAWSTATDVLDSIGVSWGEQPILRSATGARRLSAETATADLFRVLGVRPFLGRTFTAAEEKTGAPPVAVLSYGFWQTEFSGRSDALGAFLDLDGTPTEIIGVMRAGFDGPRSRRRVQLWLPLRLDRAAQNPQLSTVSIYARLRRGVTVAAAGARLDGISRTLPGGSLWRPWPALITDDPLYSETREQMTLISAAVMLVLVIACANVSSLVLGRNAARARELAIRVAVGAERFHIIRQLLVESLILTAIGSLCGLVLAGWAMSALTAFIPGTVPRVSVMNIDFSVALFAAGCAVVSGIAITLLPAIFAGQTGVAGTITSPASTDSRSTHRRRNALIVVESALAIVVLSAAILLVRAFVRLNPTSPGFSIDDRITVSLRFEGTRYQKEVDRIRFIDTLLDRLRALPGVQAVSGSSSVPLTGSTAMLPLKVADVPAETAPVEINYRAVLPLYLTQLDVPIVRGRDIDQRDSSAAEPTVVVTDEFVRRFLPGREPIGARIEIEELSGSVTRRIVGVAGNMRLYASDLRYRPEVFTSYAQSPLPFMRLIVRSSEREADLTDAIRREVAAIDPAMPIDDIETLRSIVDYSMNSPRFLAVVIGVFGATALVLAWLGVYTMAAWSVTQRTRELAIRVALGARPSDIRRLVLRYGLLVGTAGAAIGTAAALGLTRLIEAWLYGMPGRQPSWQLTLAATFILLTTLASYLPARRASRIDPMAALKAE